MSPGNLPGRDREGAVTKRSAAYETHRILTSILQSSYGFPPTLIRTNDGFLMTYKSAALLLLGTGIPLLMTLTGCSKAHANDEPPVTPPAKVVPFGDVGLFTVEHPEQFPLATASEHPTTSELIVTGAVTPDVSRNIPVVSLASGRVVGIHARLGDTVVKGQLMLSVRSDDVSGGFSNYGSVLI